MMGKENYTPEESLLTRFRDYVTENSLWQQGDFLFLACSGGADSVVMAHLLYQMNQPFKILHCNFNLRGDESKRDEDFVRLLADDLGVECLVKSFDTKASVHLMGKGIQETARKLRYDWFNAVMLEQKSLHPSSLLLTGHHADDQVETLAMHFFRGTGIAGLHGIKQKIGKLVRPLLFAARKEIIAYAEANAIVWVEDGSNQEDEYTRNHFRHVVIPQVEKVFPSVRENLLANAKRFSEMEIIYNRQIEKITSKLIEPRGNTIAIPLNKLKAVVPLDTIMFEVFRNFGFSSHQVPEIKKLFNAISGKYCSSLTHRVLRNRDWLLIDPIAENVHTMIVVEAEATTAVFNEKKLSFKTFSGKQVTDSDPNHAWIDLRHVKFPLIVRPWKAGDYFYPLGMKKKKKIARFLTDLKLSLSEKENQWVIESDRKIIWVIGRRIDDRVKICPSSKQAMLIRLLA